MTEAPRLELRWRDATEEEAKDAVIPGPTYACDYGIVLPLDANDIRSNVYNEASGETVYSAITEVFYNFSTTVRSGGKPPAGAETPFRDGSHATRDAASLGDLEVWVVGLDGSRVLAS